MGRWRTAPTRTHCRLSGLPRGTGRQGGDLQTGRPGGKDIVERLHDYLERPFLPGRRFSSPADFKAQLTGFFARANRRQMRVLSSAPADRLAADLAAMLPLPPVPPQVGWHHSTRLPRDHYIRLDANDYSVHPSAIGRRTYIHANLDRIWATCEGAIVADHERLWARHQTTTDYKHLVAAKRLPPRTGRPAGPTPRRGHR